LGGIAVEGIGMTAVGRRHFCRWLLAGSALPFLCWSSAGCGSSAGGAPKPEAQDRINKLLRLYTAYSDKNRKGPPNEEALRAFGQKLTPAEREANMLPDDLDSIFSSPRDNQKFEVQYNIRIDPGQNRAVAWEAVGKDGRRFVALTIGYVEEYDEQTLAEHKK
jgi:hypothetical protein